MARLEPEEWQQKLAAAGFFQVRAVTRDFLLPNTPAKLISLVVKMGDFLEKAPVVRGCAQSILLTATVAS
jgi:hypothetical protein